MKFRCATAAEYHAMLVVMWAAWSEDRENRAWLLGRSSRSSPGISPSGHIIWHIIMLVLTHNCEGVSNVP